MNVLATLHDSLLLALLLLCGVLGALLVRALRQARTARGHAERETRQFERQPPHSRVSN